MRRGIATIATTMSAIGVFLAGCTSAEQANVGAAQTSGATASGSGQPGSSLDGVFTYETMNDYLNAVKPSIDDWETATWPKMPKPTTTYVPKGTTGDTPCGSNGKAEPYDAMSYFYCGANTTIYIGQDQIWQFYSTTGSAGPAVALAHENGHHVQKEAGVPEPTTPAESVNHENQADCLAGAWTQYADAQHLVEYPNDLPNMENLMKLVADAETTPTEERGHGLPAERVTSFKQGLTGGAGACNSFAPATPVYPGK